MKLILKTKKTTYYVSLPNYFDSDKIDIVLNEARYELPVDVEILEHQLHNDTLTNDEKKQMDIYGEIKYPMEELIVNNILVDTTHNLQQTYNRWK
jgi:hypothetical protein